MKHESLFTNEMAYLQLDNEYVIHVNILTIIEVPKIKCGNLRQMRNNNRLSDAH